MPNHGFLNCKLNDKWGFDPTFRMDVRGKSGYTIDMSDLLMAYLLTTIGMIEL